MDIPGCLIYMQRYYHSLAESAYNILDLFNTCQTTSEPEEALWMQGQISLEGYQTCCTHIIEVYIMYSAG